MAETADYPRGVTFEDVWAMFKETDRKFQEEARVRQEEARERRQELDRRFAKTEKFMKKLGKQMGDLHNTFGEMAEHLVAPGIADRFNERGYHFDSIAPGGIKIRDSQGKVKAQIDLLLENGECIVAIEVKSRPKVKDIEHHIRRLEIFKEHRENRHEKPKKILGAIAGAIYGEVEQKAAADAGLYVLEQSGDTMRMKVPDDFLPREW